VRQSKNRPVSFCMGRSGVDRTDDFQKFCDAGLDRIQFYRIRTGLGQKNFTVRSSLMYISKSSQVLVIKLSFWTRVRLSILDQSFVLEFEISVYSKHLGLGFSVSV